MKKRVGVFVMNFFYCHFLTLNEMNNSNVNEKMKKQTVTHFSSRIYQFVILDGFSSEDP